MRKHLYIPDTQVSPGCPIDHFSWIGEYIVDKKPEVIVQGGDLADMPSLSTYDYGKKQHEGRRYLKDIESANLAVDMFRIFSIFPF